MRRPRLFAAFSVALAALLFAFVIRADAATTVPIFSGGTGTSTAPAYGQLLIGGKNGEYELVASSTFGGGGGGSSGFSTTSASYWLTQQTTSNLAEGSNLYWTQVRFDNALTATTSLPKITTLSGLSLPVSQVTGLSGTYPINYSGGVISTVATSSLGLTVSSFASHNISQWTNDTAYLSDGSNGGSNKLTASAPLTFSPATDQISLGYPLGITYGGSGLGSVGASSTYLVSNGVSLAYEALPSSSASSTLLGDNNSFSGVDSFTNASSNFAGTWQTFSPSHFQTTLGFTWPLVNSAGTVSFNGLGTTSNLTAGHIVYSSGAGTITDVATSTLTPSSPLTGSFIQIGSSGTLGIQAASASQNGYLASGDYSIIHAATTTFSGPLSYSVATNAVTCPTCNTYGWSWSALMNFGTSTISTTTAITAPSFFASSSLASQFPYATSTAFTTANFFNTGITSALALFNASHQETAYAGTNPCSANNALVSLNASGAGSCILIASSTALSDNDTFSGIDSFTNASSNFSGTWQTFSPSHFQTAGTYLTGLGNYATTTGTAISLSTSTVTASGLTYGETIAVSTNGILFTPTITGSLTGLTTGNFTSANISQWTNNSGYLTSLAGAASSTLLGDNNTFTGKDSFSNATTTLLTATTEWLPSLGTAAGTFLAVDPTGKIIATSTPAVGGGGTVTAVATTWPITGGTFSTSGTIAFNGLSTTSPWTNGNLAQVTSSNQVSSIATSSLGLTTSSFASPNISQWTNNSGYVTSSFSTTSAAYWQGVNNFFSTTSASYFLSLNQGAAFSTTSANYWGSTQGYLTSAVTSVSGTTNQISSSGGNTPVLSLPNLVIFPNEASSTNLSVFNNAYFGGTATSSFDSQGRLTFGGNANLGTNILYGSGFGSGDYLEMNGAGSYILANGNNGWGINLNADWTNIGQGGAGDVQLRFNADTSFSRLSAGVLTLGNATYQNSSGGLILASSTMTNSTASYASTTETDASTICLSGSCKSAWPAGGSGTVTSVATTYPVTGGTFTTSGTIALAFGTTTSNTWAGTQTFTNTPVFSSLGAGTVNSLSNGTVYNSATSTPGVSAPITYSGTLGQFIGGVSGNFGCTTASSGVTGCLSGSDWTTFNSKQATISATWPITFSANTVGFSGLSTTSPWTNGNLAEVSGGNLTSVATTTLAGGGPITVSNSPIVLGASGAVLGCTNASNGVTGCMSAADWGLLHTATTTFSSPLSYSVSTNAVTCPTCNTSSASVTSIATNNGITGGTITTSGTLSLDQSFGAVWTAASSTYTNHLALNTASTSQFSSPTIWDSTVGNALWLGDANGKATAYGGSSCTNQFPRSVNGVGSWTCATVANTDLAHSTIVVNSTTLTLGDAGDTITAASSTLLANNNTFSGNNTFSASTTFQQQLNMQGASTTLFSTGAFWNTGITSALVSVDANHKENAYAGASSCSANNFFTGFSALGASTCGTASISGVNLGSNLFSLTNDGATLSGSSYNGSSAISNWAINLANSNTWTASTTITKVLNLANASSSLNTFGTVWTPSITSAVHLSDSNGKLIGATTQTCTNQFVRSMSAAYAATCATVSLTADVTGTLPAGNGGTGATSLSPSFSVVSNVLSGVNYFTFTVATTTAWAGTTTIPLGPAFVAETWNGIMCFTNTGTLNVDVYYGTGPTHMALMNASTTIGTFSWSTNNTPAATNARYVNIGTPASSPQTISCTVKKTI